MAKIQYLGNKERKEDNVAGTGVVWFGHGDVQEVPQKAVGALLTHSGVWALANGEDADQAGSSVTDVEVVKTPQEQMSEADALPPMANLDTMDKAALQQYAQKYFNHEFHHKTGEEKMRQTIIGLMNRG